MSPGDPATTVKVAGAEYYWDGRVWHLPRSSLGEILQGIKIPAGPPQDQPMTDMVNHPTHYTRGPKIWCPHDKRVWRIQECIEVIRHIRDVRLATAIKYIWRVGFGGKANDREDIEKAVWYLQDWLDNPVD